jgi:LysM domain
MWTKSACVVLAWSILLIPAAAVSMKGSVRPAQANIRIAGSTEFALTSTLSVGTPFVTAKSPTASYVGQPGDTLSGIAARFAVHGGWSALYAANRSLIGPDPNVIHSGTVLTVPSLAAPVPARAPAASNPGHHLHQLPPSEPAGSRHRPLPVRTRTPATTSMPTWLKTIMLAVGLVIGAAFLVELALVIGRRRRQAVPRAAQLHTASPGQGPGSGRLAEDAKDRARIILADYDRLVVTRCKVDDTVYVLRPPGADPKAILRVARLVLPEGSYRELAEQLGLPASWPIILADYHRLVVTCSKVDDTVYVLRPPGADPKAVLRAARLVLSQDPYEELAGHLGVPANWPLE